MPAEGGVLAFGIMLATALAAPPPPPDYRAEVVGQAVRHLEALQAAGQLDAVVREGERFQEHVEPHADVAYEVALAENRRSQGGRAAMEAYDAVLDLDPSHAAARYDRGELHLSAGDAEAARADFLAAAEARPDHWVVHFRLAHLAGLAGDARGLEDHLTEALRHGFSFRTITADPTWRGWMRDPALGSVIARLIVVYDDESLIEELRGTP
jgi:tetratricopeptide (TPR) repeat protein